MVNDLLARLVRALISAWYFFLVVPLEIYKILSRLLGKGKDASLDNWLSSWFFFT